MNAFELKQKARDAVIGVQDICRKVMDTGRRCVIWVVQNPDKAAGYAAAGGAMLTGAAKVVRSVNRNITVRRETMEKRTRIYDHSMNAYLYTKRPLTAADISRINHERRATGKRTSEILEEMNLLRR